MKHKMKDITPAWLPVACFYPAFVGLSLAPQSAFAEADDSVIEEVLVVARKREENLQEVPIPISVMSEETLEERSITEMQSIEKVAPNLSFRSNGIRRSASTVFLRGVGQVNFTPEQDPKVGIYIDEVYIPRPQGALFDLLDVQQVEVLRGPQGTLFGRNTAAGLIHLRTRQPQLDETTAEISLGGGNDGQFLGSGIFNLPIVENELAARFALQRRKDDGYMKDRSGREWNTTDSTTARASLLWTPDDTFDLTFTGNYYRARETGALANCELEAGPPGTFLFLADVFGRLDDLTLACSDDGDVFTSNDNDENRLDIDNYTLSLKMNWDLNDKIMVTSVTAYQDIEELNQSWGYGTDFRGGPSFHLESGDVETNPYDSWSQEFRISGFAVDDKLSWVTGVYAFAEDGTQNIGTWAFRGLGAPEDPADAPLYETYGPIAEGAKASISGIQVLDASNESFAFFAEGTYKVSNALAISLGYRWTRDEREVSHQALLTDGSPDPTSTCLGELLPLGERCNGAEDFTEDTYRLIVDYQLSDDVLVYSSYSRGYSSGGLNTTEALTPFEPELSDNWELGFKSSLLDKRLLMNVSAFYNDYENQQVLQQVTRMGNVGVEVLNAQESTIQGVEIEIQADLGSDIYAMFTAGYIDSEFDEFIFTNSTAELVDGELTEVFEEVDATGLDALRESPLTASVSLGKNFFFKNGDSLGANIGYAYRGEIYNSLDKREVSRQKSYGLWDARLDYRLANGRTDIALWGTNLNDEEYFRFASDTGPGLGVIAKYYSEPRRYGITLIHRFGDQ